MVRRSILVGSRGKRRGVSGERACCDRSRSRARAHERALRLPADAALDACRRPAQPVAVGLPGDGAVHDPPAAGGLITTFPGNAPPTSRAGRVDGTYCYHIRVADLRPRQTGRASPSRSTRPTPRRRSPSRRRVSSAAPSASPARVRMRSRASPRAYCTPALPEPAPRARCSLRRWDTTALANGAYDVCNVVTDNAGHSATATLTVTVSNLKPPAAARPRRPRLLAPPPRRQARAAP